MPPHLDIGLVLGRVPNGCDGRRKHHSGLRITRADSPFNRAEDIPGSVERRLGELQVRISDTRAYKRRCRVEHKLHAANTLVKGAFCKQVGLEQGEPLCSTCRAVRPLLVWITIDDHDSPMVLR